jgi:hypothetical protein
MGGPWRAKGFDPAAWRPPAPRVDAADQPVTPGAGFETGIVLAYVVLVAVLTVVVGFLKGGWW